MDSMATVPENSEIPSKQIKVPQNSLSPVNTPKMHATGRRGSSESVNSHYSALGDAVKEVEDKIFDMFHNKDGKTANMAKFLGALKNEGLRETDVRLKELYKNIHEYQEANLDSDSQHIEISRTVFAGLIKENIDLINKALSKKFVIPDFQDFCKDIEEIYNIVKDNDNGANADYIPQLARPDPKNFGVSVCTVDGQRFSIGNVDKPFTIQSTSKAVNYAIALSHYGEEYFHRFVGREPSGRFFNEICLDTEGRPHNPMINAGAIMSVGLYKPEMAIGDRFDEYQNEFRKAAGHEYLGFNASVFLSERESADRNNALAYYMRENNCYPGPGNVKKGESAEMAEKMKNNPGKDKFKESLELYFQLCSQETTADSSGVIAGTMANGGVCPTTGEKVFKGDMIKHVLSLMLSCGMYDYSGHFAFSVGLPAKSGVGGSLLIVIPNLMGICVWSPPLDSHGNSCRGVDFAQRLVAKFNFHNFDNMVTGKKDPRQSAEQSKGLAIVNLLFAAQAGDISALRRYHLAGVDMNGADYDGRTALHLAASEGQKACVKYLIESCDVNIEPKDRWDHTPAGECKEKFPEISKLIGQLTKSRALRETKKASEAAK